MNMNNQKITKSKQGEEINNLALYFIVKIKSESDISESNLLD